MDRLQPMIQKVITGLKKYKFAVMIVLMGVILLLIPGSTKEEKKVTANSGRSTEAYENYGADMERKLEEILSRIEGVGQVKVVLTMKQGSTSHYLYDSDIITDKTEGGQSQREERKTVLFSKGNSYDEATVTTIDYPRFQGALIVCEGGAKPEIRLQLIQAVSALTDLRSDKISVVKMK